MFFSCPKCETGTIGKTGSCGNCGYTLRIKCEDCGHPNIPGARFCGVCGYGMTFSIRLRIFVNKKINYLNRLRVKRFAAGLSFGALLAFFAFGSMGMVSDNSFESHRIVKTAPKKVLLQKSFSKRIEADLSLCFKEQEMENNASIEDIASIIEILGRNLQPVAARVNSVRTPSANFVDYSSPLQNFSSNNGLPRGAASMILFSFISDLLEVNYRDFSQETRFSDIPRFHFLNAPVNALLQYDINFAEDTEDFQSHVSVSKRQLFTAAVKIAGIAETHLKNHSAKASKKPSAHKKMALKQDF